MVRGTADQGIGNREYGMGSSTESWVPGIGSTKRHPGGALPSRLCEESLSDDEAIAIHPVYVRCSAEVTIYIEITSSSAFGCLLVMTGVGNALNLLCER